MNFRTFDLNLLRVFEAVMLEGKLTRAAEVLAMSQPAVSNALARLRDALNDPLFIREGYGVKPSLRALQLWHTWWRDVDPLFSFVARYMYQAIICGRPDLFLTMCRGSDACTGCMYFRPCCVMG